MTKPLIVVGTPCFGGVVTQDYTISLLNLAAAGARHGFDVAVVMLGNDALITRGRSAIVGRFLDNPATTHLLFVDADICFSPDAVLRLLAFDKDFVAGLYPAKFINWNKVAASAVGQGNRPVDEAGFSYVGDVCKGAELKQENGFATGTYAGTGFQLIKRNVFERMIAAYPETKYRAVHAVPPQPQSDNLYALFDCMIDPETGVYLSEDFAFCRRWRALGGEIWLDLTSTLTHTGPYSFRGQAALGYSDLLKNEAS